MPDKTTSKKARIKPQAGHVYIDATGLIMFRTGCWEPECAWLGLTPSTQKSAIWGGAFEPVDELIPSRDYSAMQRELRELRKNQRSNRRMRVGPNVARLMREAGEAYRRKHTPAKKAKGKR